MLGMGKKKDLPEGKSYIMWSGVMGPGLPVGQCLLRVVYMAVGRANMLVT
jgi:hypothetical protein